MRYADSLGFLLSQKELMTHQGDATIDPDVALDLCHVTAAPPFMKTMVQITNELRWFLGMLALQKNIRTMSIHEDLAAAGIKVVGGLQHPPEDATLDDLKFLRRQGILFMTLAYQDQNVFGGGFLAPGAPLTTRGMELITKMAQAGVVLDLSHAGERTAADALDFIETNRRTCRFDLVPNVVATHSGCSAMYDHRRNLSDESMRRITALGGFVGIPTLTFILDENDNTLDPFYHHLTHALGVVGPDAVTIGTDGAYKSLNAEAERKLFEVMKEKLDPDGRIGARFPDQPAELNSPVKMQILAQKLSARGLQAEAVQKVVGENFINFVSRIL